MCLKVNKSRYKLKNHGPAGENLNTDGGDQIYKKYYASYATNATNIPTRYTEKYQILFSLSNWAYSCSNSHVQSPFSNCLQF